MRIILISTSTYPSDQGLRTISSCLKREGHEVKLVFMPMAEDYSLKYSESVLGQLKEICKGAKLIGVSAYASTSPRAEQVISFLKHLNAPIVWGGPHATISPEMCIEHCNIVCRGEGEETMAELADKVDKGGDFSRIPNLWVKKGNEIIKNEIRSMPDCLDCYAPPDYDLKDHYLLEGNRLVQFQEKHLNGMVFFMTTRGCPNACAYCSNHLYRQLYHGHGRLLRSYTIDYVIQELKRLKTMFPSVGVFDIRDETFFARPLEEIKEFAERYAKEVGIRWKCLADPTTMSEEKLKLLVDAGLTDIIIGIQSGSDRLNFEVYKRFIKRDQVLKAAKTANKFKGKLAVMYDVITTNPYETPEDVLETINLLREIPKPYFLSVNNLVFFLGTPLYEKAVADGIIKSKKDSAFDLNYWDRWKHIKLKKKNAYLNLVLNLMRGPVTEKRYGILPAAVLNNLLKKKSVDFNLRHTLPTYSVGQVVQIADYFREHVAKPVYRNMLPTSVKVWYDKVRYRV
ncbi:MAG TPA: B12-binding domain-containing radical SAM protein [Nanoarchaeota archaeon]|nr:B12-binding domain-containing radical SAM protein [Nanoarchaeota archaeon]